VEEGDWEGAQPPRRGPPGVEAQVREVGHHLRRLGQVGL